MAATGDDLSDIFPDDIYSKNAVHYYGSGLDSDEEAIDIIQRMRGNPDLEVDIYRAIPKDAPNKINSGDWVTISLDYAHGHGAHALNDEYKIVSQKVKAKDLVTDGNSIQEWGYDPS